MVIRRGDPASIPVGLERAHPPAMQTSLSAGCAVVMSGSPESPHPHLGFGKRGGAGTPLTQPGVPALPPPRAGSVAGQYDAHANEPDEKETSTCS